MFSVFILENGHQLWIPNHPNHGVDLAKQCAISRATAAGQDMGMAQNCGTHRPSTFVIFQERTSWSCAG
jgi:hypothetical protein